MISQQRREDDFEFARAIEVLTRLRHRDPFRFRGRRQQPIAQRRFNLRFAANLIRKSACLTGRYAVVGSALARRSGNERLFTAERIAIGIIDLYIEDHRAQRLAGENMSGLVGQANNRFPFRQCDRQIRCAFEHVNAAAANPCVSPTWDGLVTESAL